MRYSFRIFFVVVLGLIISSCGLPEKSFLIKVPAKSSINKPAFLVLGINRGKRWGIEKRYFYQAEAGRWFFLSRKNFQNGYLVEARGVETNRDYVLFTDILVLYEFKKNSEIKTFKNDGYKFRLTFSDMGIDNAEPYVEAVLSGILVTQEKPTQCIGVFDYKITKNTQQEIEVSWKNCFE